MSKLTALGQSMAALFTPESEKARKTQAKGASTVTGKGAGSFRIASAEAVGENAKMGDSLGNGSSPGYEPLHLNKKSEQAGDATEGSGKVHQPETFETPTFGPQFIRLDIGFEKLLFTQKKLCEKASEIFTKLDAPGRYRNQKKGRLLNGKSRGCIVDVTPEIDLAAPPKKDEAA
ncbi:MAG: hypothetical protein EOP11_07355 [Proteobacteria bacterium]|nr:MAG: hypothetical protein EOP11_07355 [Pseudomonadota bacterium]